MTIVEMEHMQGPTKFVSTLDQEIVVMTLTTVTRLFELGSDAFTLYGFYCKTAKLQSQQIGQTNKIKATREYCLTGLRWGKKKYTDAKNILKENGFIEDVVRKDKLGSVQGWYVQVNYLPISYKPPASESDSGSYKPPASESDSGSYKPPASLPDGGFQAPNAVNKNRNAVNENIYTPKTTTGHMVSPQKKAQKAHSKVSRSSEYLTEDTMVSLTYEELWDIANRKNVSLKTVRFIEGQVLDMIRDGNKYKAKTVSRTVQKWIDLGIGRGNIVQMNEVERMLFDLESPQQQQALVEVAGKLKEQNLL